MTRARVLVDCDGVLSDFIGGALATLNELYDTSFRREQVTEFDFTKALGMSAPAAAAAKRAIGSAVGCPHQAGGANRRNLVELLEDAGIRVIGGRP